jgi:hypothetical protein
MVPELPPPDAFSDCAPDVTVTELRWQGAESHTASELVSALNAHIETLKAEVEQLGQLTQRNARLATERECADRAIAELHRQRASLAALAQRLAITETQLADSEARTAAAETKVECAVTELFAVTQRLAIAETQLVTERERAEQATAEFRALVQQFANMAGKTRQSRSGGAAGPAVVAALATRLLMPRRLPAPWRVDRIPGGYVVCDGCSTPNTSRVAASTRPANTTIFRRYAAMKTCSASPRAAMTVLAISAPRRTRFRRVANKIWGFGEVRMLQTVWVNAAGDIEQGRAK